MSRFQRAQYDCGPTAVENAAKILGLTTNTATIEIAAGCTARDGTPVEGIKSAVTFLGLRWAEGAFDDSEVAWAWLRGHLFDGHPVLLCIDEWEHYITAVGIIGDRVIVNDPENEYSNMIENGQKSWTRRQLISRWRAEEPEGEKPIWGLAIF